MNRGRTPTDTSSLRHDLVKVASTFIAKYGWTLLSEDDLVERVLTAAQSDDVPNDLTQSVVRQYTTALYEACRHTSDVERRNKAYSDLFRYLYRNAYSRWPDVAEDIAQQALELVYQQIDNCREPVGFLQFALWKLRQAHTEVLRRRSDLSFDQVTTREALNLPSTETALADHDCLQAVLEALRQLPNMQKRAIFLKFFEGLSDEAISERLGVTANHIRVIRNRALGRLRQDGHLREACLEALS